MAEISEQLLICEYISTNYPSIVFTSDFSGIRLSIGLAKKVKNLKSGRGIPDLIILKPFELEGKLYYGLLIELKKSGTEIYKKDGSLRKSEHLEEQNLMLEILRKEGYYATFSIGYNDTIDLIDKCYG